MCLSPPPPFNQPSDIGYGKEWEEKLKVYQAMRATLLPLPPLLLLLRPRRGGGGVGSLGDRVGEDPLSASAIPASSSLLRSKRRRREESLEKEEEADVGIESGSLLCFN